MDFIQIKPQIEESQKSQENLKNHAKTNKSWADKIRYVCMREKHTAWRIEKKNISKSDAPKRKRRKTQNHVGKMIKWSLIPAQLRPHPSLNWLCLASMLILFMDSVLQPSSLSMALYTVIQRTWQPFISVKRWEETVIYSFVYSVSEKSFQKKFKRGDPCRRTQDDCISQNGDFCSCFCSHNLSLIAPHKRLNVIQ